MVSRENRVTAAFVLLSLPASYAVQYALQSSGVPDRYVFPVSFFALLLVAVLVPTAINERARSADGRA